MLDLHLVQEDVAVFCEFYLTGTTYEPIKNLKIFKYIFKVPLGPRLDFITSCNPIAALIFIAKAWIFLSTSAFGFKY